MAEAEALQNQRRRLCTNRWRPRLCQGAHEIPLLRGYFAVATCLATCYKGGSIRIAASGTITNAKVVIDRATAGTIAPLKNILHMCGGCAQPPNTIVLLHGIASQPKSMNTHDCWALLGEPSDIPCGIVVVSAKGPLRHQYVKFATKDTCVDASRTPLVARPDYCHTPPGALPDPSTTVTARSL